MSTIFGTIKDAVASILSSGGPPLTPAAFNVAPSLASIAGGTTQVAGGINAFIHRYRWHCHVDDQYVNVWSKSPPLKCTRCGTNHAIIGNVQIVDSTDPAKKIQLGLPIHVPEESPAPTQPVVPGASGTMHANFIATAGQYKFTCQFGVSGALVFRNGMLQQIGADYILDDDNVTIRIVSPCEAEEVILIQYVPYGPQGNAGLGPVGVQGYQGYVGIQGYAGTQGVWNPMYGNSNTIEHNTADLAVKASALDALMNDSGDIPPAVRQWLLNKKSGKKGPQGVVEMKPSMPGDRKLDLEEN